MELFQTTKSAASIAVKVLAVLGIAAGMAFAQIASGTAGDDLIWVIDDDGTLTISGTGAMPNYDEGGAPWHSNKSSITKLLIENGITIIGNNAFNGYDNLTGELLIPNSVYSIGNNAFKGCSGFTGELLIPNGSGIGSGAFQGCSGFTGELVIPNSVRYIYVSAFQGCSGFTSLIIGNSVNQISNNAFAGCSGLTGELVIPSSVRYIQTYAFQNCSNLTSVVIWSSGSLSDRTFMGCRNLTSVVIGSAVTSIGEFAFYNCSGLTQIINRATTPQTLGGGVFGGVTVADVKLFVPAQSLSAYQAADVWKDFNTNSAIFMLNGAQSTRVDETQTLTAEFDEDYAGDKTITWESVTPAVATVSGDGTITGVSFGTAVISAAVDGFIDVFVVNIAKGAGTFVSPDALNTIYTPTLKLSDLELQEGYRWNNNAEYTSLNAGNGQNFTAYYTDPSGNYETATGTIVVNVAKAAAEDFGSPDARNITYTPTLKLSNVWLDNGYAWSDPTTPLSVANSGQSFAATYAQNNNYEPASGTIVVNVAKANVNAPTGLTATVGQTLSDVSLADYPGWAWRDAPASVGEIGERAHVADYTPSDPDNYNNRSVSLTVAVSAATPIKNLQKSDGRIGIRLSNNVVSDKAEFEIILSNKESVLQAKVVIYDNVGNVVFEKTQREAKFVWNLTNIAGRNVANGSYLIVVEAKGAKGSYAYSAKVGVKR